MAKNIRRMFAMVLVMCMILSALPMQALAAEGDGIVTDGPVVENTADGLTVTTTTTTETQTDGANTTVTVTIEKATEGTSTEGTKVDNKETATTTTTENSETGASSESTVVVETKKEETADGVKTDYQQTSTENTTVEADGTVKESSSVDGTEKKEWIEKDTGDGEQPSVEVELKPGETTTGTATDVTVEGDINSMEGQTTTTTTDRTVITTTSEIKVTVNDSDTGLVEEQETGLKGLPPVYDETDEVKYSSNGKISDASGKDGLFDRNFLSQSNADPSKWVDIPPEGEYRYIGTGEHSKYFVGVVKVIYQKDDNGNTIYDEQGQPVIEKLVNSVNGSDITSNGVIADEIIPEYEIDLGFSSSRAQNFMLMDKNGNRVFAYCCDAQTGAVNGTWYSVANLEDSEYYTPEAEKHIRAIAMNGYWGTSDIAKEDGSYETGSLEGIKSNLMKAIENGDIDRYVQVPVRDTTTDGAGKIQVDENGDPIYYEEKMDLMEILAGMTEGEALLATQAAIWSFANGSQGATSGIDGPVVITPDWYRNHQIGYGKVEGEPLDDAAGARVAALYNWLMKLETEKNPTVVINDKNFVEDMSITVHEKDATHENNADDNQDNDVYNTDLNFKLAFIPGEKDDLLVQITYNDLEGNPVTVIRRLAGTNAEGQTYEGIKPEKDGSYVLKGLKLSENEDFNFDLRLEGTQYLENGVYVYSAVGGRDVSQTFVGVAEGTRNVDVSVGVTIKFEVDENNYVVAEREWHYKEDPITPPPADHEPTPVNDEGEPVAPQVFRLNNQDNLEEIPEEPVPLAAPAITGDNSGLWVAVILLSLFCMVAVNVFDKKRQHEAF